MIGLAYLVGFGIAVRYCAARQGAENAYLWSNSYTKRSFYQDRLGTNTGKALKKRCVSRRLQHGAAQVLRRQRRVLPHLLVPVLHLGPDRGVRDRSTVLGWMLDVLLLQQPRLL